MTYLYQLRFMVLCFFCTLMVNPTVYAKMTITNLQPERKGEIFPEVVNPEQPVIAKKINAYLQLDHLQHLPNVYEKHPFENVREDKNRCCGYTTFDSWRKHKTPKNILSLRLTGESMGAYPENFDIYENFDTRTGNQVLLSHLVKLDSKTALNALLIKKIRHRINAFIKKTNNSNKINQSLDEQEYVATQTAIYEQCLEDLSNVELHWFHFYVKADSVVFIKGRCTNHAMRAYDELGDHHIAVPIKSLLPYLTTYGKNVLSSSSNQIHHKHLAGKMLTGKIGKARVNIIFDETRENNKVNATYWYHKYQHPIALNGTLIDGQLIAKERHYDNVTKKWLEKAIIQATWQDNRLIGTWQDVKTHKIYQLRLK